MTGGHVVGALVRDNYQHPGFIDTGGECSTAAIWLAGLWESFETQINFGGVAAWHHRPPGDAGTGVRYCTEGMIFAAGTSQPSRVGGQGMAMNQSKAM